MGRVTTSIGINTGTISKDSDPTVFLEGADRSLYRAKESGRNRYKI